MSFSIKPPYIIAIVFLALVILAVAFRKQISDLFTKNKPKETPPTGSQGSNTNTNNSNNSQSLDSNKYLVKGSTGNEVKILQHWLNAEPFNSKLDEDGVFGSLTEDALMKAKCVMGISLNDFPNKKCNETPVVDETHWYDGIIAPFNW